MSAFGLPRLSQLGMVGLQWQGCDPALREHCSRRASGLPVPREVPGSRCRELLLLSTCNRLELYYVRPGDDPGRDPLVAHLFSDVPRKFLHFRRGRRVLLHLFRTAAGLDSMVLGEPQITGQVREAYAAAVARGCAGVCLHRVFHQAFATARKIRSLTDLSRGVTTYANAVVRLARENFPAGTGLRVLLLGAGEMGREAAAALAHQPGVELTVLGRGRERAEELVRRFGGRAASLDELVRFLPSADLVVGALQSPEPVLGPDPLPPSDRGVRLLVDLGLPRNFHPELAKDPGIRLHSLDELAALVDRGRRRRRAAASQAAPLIAEAVQAVEDWYRSSNRGDAARRLSLRVGEILSSMGWSHPAGQPPTLFHSLVKLVMHAPGQILDRETGESRWETAQRVIRFFTDGPLDVADDAPFFRSAALVQGARLRFLLDPPVRDHPDAERLSRLRAEEFVHRLLAPANAQYRNATCAGRRRALQRDAAHFLPGEGGL